MPMKLLVTVVSFLKRPPSHSYLASARLDERLNIKQTTLLGKVDAQLIGQYCKVPGISKRVLKSKMF